MPVSEPLPHFVDDLLAYLHETHPTHATLDGVHTHDDLLEDLSRQGIEHIAQAGVAGDQACSLARESLLRHFDRSGRVHPGVPMNQPVSHKHRRGARFQRLGMMPQPFGVRHFFGR